MANCAFPNCNRHAEKNGYCVGHRIYAKGSDSKPTNKTDQTGDTKKKSPAPGSRGDRLS